MRMNVPLAHTRFGAKCLSVLALLALAIECRRLAKRADQAEARMADLAREAGALNDDLLQSIQGLMLSFYVAASMNPTTR